MKRGLRNSAEDQLARGWAEMFGRNFRHARLAAGLSIDRSEFAMALAAWYLQEVETGAGDLSLESMVFLADLVGSDVGSLLDRGRRAPERTPRVRACARPRAGSGGGSGLRLRVARSP